MYAVVAMLGLALLLSACAVFNRENTPTLNLVEDHLWPESTGARVVAFPAVFVLGVAAALVDAAVVHPTLVVDDSWRDTRDMLWDHFDWDEDYVTECASLPWRTAFTPVVFTGDFLARALFDIPSRADEIRRRETVEAKLDEAEAALEQANANEAFEELRIRKDLHVVSDETQARHALLLLRAAREAGRLKEVPEDLFYRRNRLLKTSYGSELEALLRELRSAEHPYERWIATELDLSLHYETPTYSQIARGALQDSNAQVRLRMVTYIDQNHQNRWIAMQVRPLLQEVANTDPDPMVQAYAADLLSQLPK